MHAIKERPVVVDGQIVIRPIMVVALTYDHRLLDGREAVTFLGEPTPCCTTSLPTHFMSSQGPRLPPRPRQDASGIDAVPGTLTLPNPTFIINNFEYVRFCVRARLFMLSPPHIIHLFQYRAWATGSAMLNLGSDFRLGFLLTGGDVLGHTNVLSHGAL